MSFLTGIFLFGAMVAFVVGIAFLIDGEKKFICFICAIWVAFAVLTIVKLEKAPPEYIHTSTEYIVALNDNNLASGRFYMRSSRINEDLWYQYMYKKGNGYKTNKCKARTSTVYCSDSEIPRVEWYRVERTWLIFKMTDPDKQKKIYIPEGSIIEDFYIDLQ